MTILYHIYLLSANIPGPFPRLNGSKEATQLYTGLILKISQLFHRLICSMLQCYHTQSAAGVTTGLCKVRGERVGGASGRGDFQLTGFQTRLRALLIVHRHQSSRLHKSHTISFLPPIMPKTITPQGRTLKEDSASPLPNGGQ